MSSIPVLKIALYNDQRLGPIRIEEVADYVRRLFPFVVVEVRDEFLRYAVNVWGADKRWIAYRLASSRVLEATSCKTVDEPLPGEVFYEERAIFDLSMTLLGVAYEGYALQELFSSLIPREEKRYSLQHIILTSRLLVTREPREGRGHARTIILGIPALISISGIVEAPALEPYTYLKLQFIRSPDLQSLFLEEERRRLGAIRYGDERLTEVVKGYVLQAIFYHLTGEPFCSDKHCRLYNAHTQEELIEAQITSGRLCKKHEEILRKLAFK
jgi:hypothetical protein